VVRQSGGALFQRRRKKRVFCGAVASPPRGQKEAEAMGTTKLDLTKEYKSYYTAKTTPEIVELGEAQFLTIEGEGAPGGEEFTAKLGTLYALAYGIKTLMKKVGRDFTVAKLEGLWWVESDRPYLEVPREEWRWKLLIRQPEFVTSETVEAARGEVLKKKGMALVNEVGFETMAEGKCVQILHIGPYATEPESLAKMRRLMEEQGLVPHGLHHEIYLSDPRRVSEERLKTILRQPVKLSTPSQSPRSGPRR